MKKKYLVLFFFLICAQFISSQDFNVLVFHETNGYRHNAAINASISMLEEFGENNNHDTWSVDNTRDASVFTDENLANYEVIVFSNTTGGELLNDAQQAAMENFIQNGGGFIGFHSATDTYRNTDEGSSWPWYNELVGAIVQTNPNHTSNNLPGTMNVLMEHPVIAHIGNVGAIWDHEEEWYYWELNGGQLSDTNENLLEVQSTGNQTYDETRPITWLKEFDGGRSFYTALGHNAATYNNNDTFREMVEKAVLWVANRLTEDTQTADICNEDAPIGETIALKKSGGDEAWITIDSTTNDLIANGNEDSRAIFLVEEHPDGCIALKSTATDLYVQVFRNTGDAISTNGNSPGAWENFAWNQIGINQVALRSEFTNNWLQASWEEDNTSLYPTSEVIDDWETLDYVFVDDAVLSTDEFEILETENIIYPNPVSTILTIEKAQFSIVRIYNTHGQALISKSITEDIQKIDLRNLQSGVYFALIENEKGLLNKKIIKK